MISNIESIVGDNYLQYLKNNSKLVSGLLPSNAIKRNMVIELIHLKNQQ